MKKKSFIKKSLVNVGRLVGEWCTRMQSVETAVTCTLSFVRVIFFSSSSLVFIFLMWTIFLGGIVAMRPAPTSTMLDKFFQMIIAGYSFCPLSLGCALSAVTPYSSYFYLCSFTSWILDECDCVVSDRTVCLCSVWHTVRRVGLTRTK